MKEAFWKSDWFVGLIITLMIVMFAGSSFIQGIERSAYDLGVRSSSRIPSNKIAIIAIDDESIANIGRWPWTRDVHAQMHELLTEGGAKAIGQTVFFLEPQIDPGLKYIRELNRAIVAGDLAVAKMTSATEAEKQKVLDAKKSSVKTKPRSVAINNPDNVQQNETNTDPASDDFSSPSEILAVQNSREFPSLLKVATFLKKSPEISDDYDRYRNYLVTAEITLDTDRNLAQSMALGGNVVRAMPFIPGEPLGRPDEDLPEYVRSNKLSDNNITDGPATNPDGYYPVATVNAIPPIKLLGTQAAGIGSLVILPDVE